jgi:hypothetical protein
MALSAFDDRAKPPQEAELRATLGNTWSLWEDLRRRVAASFPPPADEWGFATKSAGWGFRLKQKDRVILYLIPQAGHFLVGVVLGEKAVRAAHECGLPDHVLELIDSARVYAEGRGVRFPVTTPGDVDVALKLAAVKIAR